MYQNYITTIKTHLVLINKIPFGLLIVSFYKNVVYYFFIVPILDINKIPVLTSLCFFVVRNYKLYIFNILTNIHKKSIMVHTVKRVIFKDNR